MNARFVRVSWGLEYTNAFFHVDTIKAYIQSFEKGREVDQTTKMKEEITLLAQDRMEEEINQTIRTCDSLTKEELFDYLSGWIDYFKLSIGSIDRIKKSIDSYNEITLREFDKYVEIEEHNFKQTNQYKTLNHLDFIEVDNTPLITLFLPGASISPKNRLVQYRKFFEIKGPDLIDIRHISKYIDFIHPIVDRCINIAEKRLKYLVSSTQENSLPNAVSAAANHTIVINNNLPALVPEETLRIPAKENKTKKLRLNLSVKEIACMFKVFQEVGLISAEIKNTEIAAFVNANISSKESEDVSVGNLTNNLSVLDDKAKDFWIQKGKDIQIKATNMKGNNRTK